VKAVLLPGSRQVRVVERHDPVPGPGQALIRVRASALCRSDMSLYDGTPVVGGAVAGTGTIVPGHEAAGEIAALGPDTDSPLHEGDRVAINLAVGCGHCRWCLRGYRMLCAEWQCMGFDVDGGDAELMVVPAANCMPIPDSMTFDAACVATDMIGTQYSIQKRLDTSGSDTIAVFGTGPMGGAAILVGKARGARVIALDVLESRMEYARGLGADEVLDARDPDIVDRLRASTGGLGPDVALECAGKPAAENAALDAVRPLGRVAFVGESPATTVNPSDQWLRKMTTVLGAWYFATWEWPEIVDFITHHDLPAGSLITHRYSLDEAEEAFRAFDARETGKAILTP
jgi:propanol-preferring alcohol dehydrogenase